MSVAEAAAEPRALPLRVLLLDDDPGTLKVLSRILGKEGHDALEARTLAEARAILASTVPDVAVVDVHLKDEDGLDCVQAIRRNFQDMAVVVISSEDTEELAKKALDSGADDFLSKPISPTALLLTVRKLQNLRNERTARIALQRRLAASSTERVFPNIVHNSDAMEAVLNLVRKVAARDLSVLVCGESGSGKELVAQAIHQQSPRADGPFIELNCAALPANLVESELFGHEKGAFTGALNARAGKIEQADGGTLFLDEIGELPLEIQPKLLRALQEKHVTRVGGKATIRCDFRLITAT
ncbi:MAG: sigma-54 dependent transcriptional regulator, partial [Sumerlaeia bacterium]